LKKLPRSFYLRPTLQVARDLLGKHLIRVYKGKKMIGRIVETEAYCENDDASHAFRGRTKRNDVMFWKGGHLYVYFTYGMHFCANVVTREKEMGEAVLIRAIEPLEGIGLMLQNRFQSQARLTAASLATLRPPTNLTNGPAKLCQALHLRREQNGTDLLGGEIYILDAPYFPTAGVGTSRRTGIVKAKEKKWRFFVKGNRWVSR
jgi:DNA-3-methyladenine glycosylase